MLNQVNTDMARASRALMSALDRMRHRFDVLDARLSPEKALDDLSMKSMAVDDLASRAERSLQGTVSEMRRRYDVVNAKLSPSAGLERIGKMGDRVESLWVAVDNGVSRRMQSSESRLESLSGRLESLNPRNVLSRGYGLVTDAGGRAVTSIDDIQVGARVTVHMRDGRAEAEIKEKVRE